MTAATPELAAVLAQLAKVLVDQAAIPPEPAPPPRLMPERVLLKVEEAAERLRIGRTLAWRLVRTGELESVRIGKLRRVHVDAVRAYAGRLTAKGTA
ncbi:MAG TPA: helix-turn-helix domain-containing protein [Actinophytocola sp.]|uniref:helix-turn-helix domain-containing protein n=1 Tax=Actinophytocola sp. TaxID=1872138 RepID=UPI002DBF13FB|nr:helix-turn-helix domain-containing protein [Actinophytocola sp.]HEU5475659.1 helix-turn-helix domain-containing protein [Actinophytocola sp.]